MKVHLKPVEWAFDSVDWCCSDFKDALQETKAINFNPRGYFTLSRSSERIEYCPYCGKHIEILRPSD